MSAVAAETQGESLAGEADMERVSLSGLIDWFAERRLDYRRVGLEVEYGLVRPDSGTCVGYEEDGGTRDLLHTLVKTIGGTAVVEGTDIVGVALPDGSALTLEMAGAIEYSSAPFESLTEALTTAEATLRTIARIADGLKIRLLTGGIMPFESPDHIRWAPKPRTAIMRNHFRELGADGRYGDSVMGLTLSTQVSLDYLSEQEYIEKLHTMVMVSPLLSALLVSTPDLHTARSASAASRRMLYWRRIDPIRCQDLTESILGASDFAELTATLTRLPMIYRRSMNSMVQASDRTFAEALVHGFEDGSYPRISDWKMHLAQIWPTVRPRQTLETRLPDGQPWSRFGTIPALFTGLVEDADIRREVYALVKPVASGDLDRLTVEIARHGITGLSPQQRGIATDLVRLAQEGLRIRGGSGFESDRLPELLNPLLEVSETGRTFSDALLDQWHGAWGRDPSRYVEAMSVPLEPDNTVLEL